MKRGYARVSTGEQNLALQVQALTAAGCSIKSIHTDKIGGAGRLGARPGYAALSRLLAPGDELIIWRLDRLSRDVAELTGAIAGLRLRGVTLVSITENLDASNASGQLVVNVLACMAQYERETLRERVNAGIAAARVTAESWGRPAALSPSGVAAVRRLAAEGLPIGHIAKQWNVSRNTVRAAIEGTGPYE